MIPPKLNRGGSRVPGPILRALRWAGRAIGYLTVRPEADRLGHHLNASIDESFAYVGRALEDLRSAVQAGASHYAAGLPGPALAHVARVLAALEPGAVVLEAGSGPGAAADLTALGFHVRSFGSRPPAGSPLAEGSGEPVAAILLAGGLEGQPWRSELGLASELATGLPPGAVLVAVARSWPASPELPGTKARWEELLEGWEVVQVLLLDRFAPAAWRPCPDGAAAELALVTARRR